MLKLRHYLHRTRHFVRRGEFWRAAGFKLLTVLEKRLGVNPRLRDIPLLHADFRYFFPSLDDASRLKIEEQQAGESRVETNIDPALAFPLTLTVENRELRYAYLPARHVSRGLVVLFHGWKLVSAYQPWDDFDILAPYDAYGIRGQGSWFWGEQGDNFVERMITPLIEKYCAGKPWFCYGGSMGGFGALYHGIRRRCDGIYTFSPQINLRAKVIEYGIHNRLNPYGYLQGKALDTVPDIFEVARSQDDLPPLMLIQNQYDPVNYFSDHAFRLLDIYNEKEAWYALRVSPAVGHIGFGASMDEAAHFYRLILEKSPPRRTTLRAKWLARMAESR